MKFERLRQKVLEENYPSEQELEEIEQKYREISAFIEKEFDQSTHFAGSAGRATCMKDDRDIDIFVLFPESVDPEELEQRALEIGKKTFKEFDGKHHVEYAEHPYVKGRIDGFKVEIVPCYDTGPESIKSSVDRTPHHTRWTEENLSDRQRKDVVVLKKFLDAGGLYGSSLKVRGFSGYLCEILVSESGSFRQLVEEAASWSEDEVLYPAGYYEEKLPSELEEKFSRDELVVIDPVDPERNVASVLSTENYSKFIYRCWRFQSNPGMNYFRSDETEYSEFEVKQELKRRSDFMLVEFENIDDVDDIVYPQLRKALRRLKSELEEKSFRIYESGFYVGQTTKIFFEMDRKLPEVQEKDGPKVFHGRDHLEQFSSKYSNIYVEEDRIKAKTEREFTDAREFLQHFLKEGDLEKKGVPDRVAEKLEDFSFASPLEGDSEWFNYLGEKLKIQHGENDG
ncbi:MAG: CCA tRNA nucleotidyltransferase [Candidatus Nanohaloarchaea archaeon]